MTKEVVCYHGTDFKFDIFKDLEVLKKEHPSWRNHYFFSNSKTLASQYGKNILKCLLDTTDFKAVNFSEYIWMSDQGTFLEREIEKAKEEGFKGLIAKNITDRGKDTNHQPIKSDNYIVWTKNIIKNAKTGKIMYEATDGKSGVSNILSGKSFSQTSSNPESSMQQDGAPKAVTSARKDLLKKAAEFLKNKKQQVQEEDVSPKSKSNRTKKLSYFTQKKIPGTAPEVETAMNDKVLPDRDMSN